MPKNMTLPSLYPKSFMRFIFKHHAFFAFIVVLAYLIFAVTSLNQILTQPEDESYRQQQLTGSGSNYSFKEETAEKVDALQDNQPPRALPAGRVNPFAE